MGIDEAFKGIVGQGVFADLFVIACGVIAALSTGIVVLYKEASKDRGKNTEAIGVCQTQQKELYERYLKELPTIVGAMERSTVAIAASAASADSRSRAIMEFSELIRTMKEVADQRAARLVERADRIDRGVEEARAQLAAVEQELIRLRAGVGR